jgi:hypothetical protein
LRSHFGWNPIGKVEKQAELLRNLEGVQEALARRHGLNTADFPPVHHFKR